MSGYPSFSAHNYFYRDERRDPRVRHVNIDRRSSITSTDEPFTPVATDKREPSNGPSSNDVNDRPSGLQETQNQQDPRKIKRDSPTPTSLMKIPATRSTVEHPEKTNILKKLTIGEDISDPFTCNLTDDDGKRCIRDFSGVSRVSDWELHVKGSHQKLGSGTFTTNNNLGRFAALTTQPDVAVPNKTIQDLPVSPFATISSPRLGKSSLKRRKTVDENSDETTKETSVVVKKSRMTKDVVSNKIDLASVLAKMNSYKSQSPPQNTPLRTQSLPTKILSISRETSLSPPPPPPPPPPHLPALERTAKHRSASPMAPCLSISTVPGLPPAEDRISSIPPSPTTETTNLTPVVASMRFTSTNGEPITPITVNPESLSSMKPYINEMHKGGFSAEDIQKAFKKRHNIDLTYETIQSVIDEYTDLPPLETPSRALHSTTLIRRPRSRSSSTTASSIPGIKHESPQYESPQASPLVIRTSNIFIPLDDLSAEQGLTALESLQSSLPEKIERLRLKIQEERAEKERLRKEEEDEVVKKHVAEIKGKLDVLDKMKRADVLDMLNREIEQKRLGLNGRSTESPVPPPAQEVSVETTMLLDEIGVFQAESIPMETHEAEPFRRDSSEPWLPSFVEEPEEMDIEPVQARESQDHLHSPEKASNSEYVSQAMEVDSQPARVPRFDQKPDHLSEMDEIALEDEESSTNDSCSPSIVRQSPEKEVASPPLSKRVSFAEPAQTRRITPIPRRGSLPSLQETNTDRGLFDDKSMSPETSPISPSISRGVPTGPASMNLSQLKTKITTPIAYHGLSNPATVLLTNTFDEWSNFCVGLGSDGNIDLLDSRIHGSAKGRAMVWNHDYTGSCAINGAWISPGELALVDKDSRRNREGAQITLARYMDTQFSTRPQITPLRKSPHLHGCKITAITPLGIKGERRSFATGDEKGNLYSWQVARDSSVGKFTSIHNHFVWGVGALTYNSEKAWLLSASKSRLYMTDMVKQMDAGEFIPVNNHIVSISPNPVSRDLTIVGMRDRNTPLALLDYRRPARKAVVETFQYPIRMGEMQIPPWNHSGTWKPDGNYFILGGFRDVHIWDIRRPLKPVSSINLGLGDRMILSTKIIGDELLAMSGRQLAWAKLDDSK